MPYYLWWTPNTDPYGWVGEVPVRPDGVISDRLWEILRECWSKTPGERPPIIKVRDTFSNPNARPKAIYAPQRRSTIGRLPGKMRIHIQSMQFTPPAQQHEFCAKIKYAKRAYVTARTKLVNSSGEHTWFAFHLLLSSPHPLSPTQEKARKLGV